MVLAGKNAITSEGESLIGQSLDEVQIMHFYKNGYNPTLSDTLPLALGLDFGFQGLTAENPVYGSAASGGYLIYPNKSNNNMMRSVYNK